MSTLPVSNRNRVAELLARIQNIRFPQVLDFGRYDIRIAPALGLGYFKSQIDVGTFAGSIHLQGTQVLTTSYEMPPQVRLALQRAGYDC